MKKRNILVAMMTALALCVTAVPASVYAQDATAETTVTQETENTEASNVNGADDPDRKSTRLNSSHRSLSRMPSSA